MRSIRNAILAYGLVNVPVGVATAAKRKEPSFRILHNECSSPIKQKRFCETCDKELHSEDLIQGFEYTKGNFVLLPHEELEALEGERSPIIRIDKFVPFDEVDELAVERSYYLVPNQTLASAYVMLSRAMQDCEVVGIGTQTLWGKETPALVWTVESGAMIVSPLFCWDEIVPDDDIVDLMETQTVSDENMSLARDLITLYSEHFSLGEDLVSMQRERMDGYLAKKVSGAEFEAPEAEEEPTPTIDLMEQLRASIEKKKAEVAA